MAIIIAALATAPATAQSGRWTARVRAVAVVPDDDGEPVGGTGSSIAAAGSLGVEAAVGYALRPRWALELALGVAAIDLESEGGQAPGIDAGTIDLQSAALSLTYRFATEGKIDPYLGLGVAYLNPGGWEVTPDLLAAGIGDIAFTTDFRLSTQVGADWTFGARWRLNADLRYVPMTTRMTFVTSTGETLDKAALQINPILVSLGVGYSF
jgi:outer membrane protein W